MSYLKEKAFTIIVLVFLIIALWWSFTHQNVSSAFVGDSSEWALKKLVEVVTSVSRLFTFNFNF